MGFPTTTGWTTSNKHGFSSFWASSKALVGSSNTKHAGAVAIASRLARKSALVCRFSLRNLPKSKVKLVICDDLPLSLHAFPYERQSRIHSWHPLSARRWRTSSAGSHLRRVRTTAWMLGDFKIKESFPHTHTHTYRVVVICFPPQAQRYGAGGTVSAMSIKDSKK